MSAEIELEIQPEPAPTSDRVIPPPVNAPPAEYLNVDFCVLSNPSWVQMALFGFQHYLVLLGHILFVAYSVVPSMGGTDGDKAQVIQTFLLMSGVNTMLQTWIGTRLPTVSVPSYAYFFSVWSICRDFWDTDFPSPHQRFVHTMRAIQGALIVSSFFIMSYSTVWGKLTRGFSPIIIAPLVSLVGLGQALNGIPRVASCLEYGLTTLLLIVACQYLKNIHCLTRTALDKFALLITVAIVWVFPAILTKAGVYKHVNDWGYTHSCQADAYNLLPAAPWFRIPYPFQWGAPTFKASHIFGMIGAVLVSSTESTGSFIAAARLAGATAPPAHVISRSVGLQGIGQLLHGMFGAPAGVTTSVENVGLLGLTGVGSRRVVQVSTLFMIFFSIFGKFGAFFASIPLPIFFATYCILYGIVASTGLSFFQFANRNSMRNIYVLGFSLFLGVSVPRLFEISDPYRVIRTKASWFNDISNTLLSSPPLAAVIVGIFLDNTLETTAPEERGIPWWAHFQKKNGDTRNEEFYGFPKYVQVKYLREWLTRVVTINGRY